MLTNIRACAVALLGIMLAFDAQAADKEIPLTGFLPSLDFLPVENTAGDRGLGWNGSCLGIAESAVARFDEYFYRNTNAIRLSDIGGDLVKSRGPKAGDQFLKEMNRLAQNISYSDLTKAPRTGPWLAEWVVDELTRTHKPLVLGLDMPNALGADMPKARHALVVYNATKFDGKFKLMVGDPNFPRSNNLAFIYDPKSDGWQTENYPAKAFPEGELRPCFVRWDEQKKQPADVARRDALNRLVNKIQDAILDKTLTARTIADDRKLTATVPLTDRNPATKRADRPASPAEPLEGTTWTDGTKVIRFEKDGKVTVREPKNKYFVAKDEKLQRKGNELIITYTQGTNDPEAIDAMPLYWELRISDMRGDRPKMRWSTLDKSFGLERREKGDSELRKQ